MKKIGIILTPNNRSKAYLQKIIYHNIKINEIIFLDNGDKDIQFSQDMINESKKVKFDISKSVEESLKGEKLEYKKFDFIDINNSELVNHIKKSETDFFIFSGGGILKKDILNTGSKFIHFHPGITPKYRGSTCFYYSIINENQAGVTAFIMEEGLDTGKIVFQQTFKKPDHEYLDEVYDPHIRSETLIDVLTQNLLEKGDFKEQTKEGETYFIIHPVLKHISILSCLK